jgi:hypothetical protein
MQIKLMAACFNAEQYNGIQDLLTMFLRSLCGEIGEGENFYFARGFSMHPWL